MDFILFTTETVTEEKGCMYQTRPGQKSCVVPEVQFGDVFTQKTGTVNKVNDLESAEREILVPAIRGWGHQVGSIFWELR